MKKSICGLLSAIMVIGTVTVHAGEPVIEEEINTYRVTIGNKYIVKNEERIQSDAEIYLDNDCIMLPVRTFFTSVNKNTRINWDEENKNASVLIGEYHILLNAEKNKIEINGENIPVSGKIAIKDGRLFIPIRNWKDIFNTLGYKITDEDIIWNDENKEAVIKITERKVDTKEPNEFILSEKGKSLYMRWSFPRNMMK